MACYSVGEQIGEGGFGTVHTLTSGGYSINMVAKMITKSATVQRCSVREAVLSAIIDHPHIGSQKGMGMTHDSNDLYIVYDRHTPLLEYDLDRMSHTKRKKMVDQLMDAVAYLHIHHGLVHGDISLENILISGDGRLILTDLGSAYFGRFPSTRLVLPKAEYLPPEKNADPFRVDVWGMGLVAIYLLTGVLMDGTATTRSVTELLANHRIISGQIVDRIVRAVNPCWRDSLSLFDFRMERGYMHRPSNTTIGSNIRLAIRMEELYTKGGCQFDKLNRLPRLNSLICCRNVGDSLTNEQLGYVGAVSVCLYGSRKLVPPVYDLNEVYAMISLVKLLGKKIMPLIDNRSLWMDELVVAFGGDLYLTPDEIKLLYNQVPIPVSTGKLRWIAKLASIISASQLRRFIARIDGGEN